MKKIIASLTVFFFSVSNLTYAAPFPAKASSLRSASLAVSGAGKSLITSLSAYALPGEKPDFLGTILKKVLKERGMKSTDIAVDWRRWTGEEEADVIKMPRIVEVTVQEGPTKHLQIPQDFIDDFGKINEKDVVLRVDFGDGITRFISVAESLAYSAFGGAFDDLGVRYRIVNSAIWLWYHFIYKNKDEAIRQDNRKVSELLNRFFEYINNPEKYIEGGNANVDNIINFREQVPFLLAESRFYTQREQTLKLQKQVKRLILVINALHFGISETIPEPERINLLDVPEDIIKGERSFPKTIWSSTAVAGELGGGKSGINIRGYTYIKDSAEKASIYDKDNNLIIDKQDASRDLVFSDDGRYVACIGHNRVKVFDFDHVVKYTLMPHIPVVTQRFSKSCRVEFFNKDGDGRYRYILLHTGTLTGRNTCITVRSLNTGKVMVREKSKNLSYEFFAGGRYLEILEKMYHIQDRFAKAVRLYRLPDDAAGFKGRLSPIVIKKGGEHTEGVVEFEFDGDAIIYFTYGEGDSRLAFSPKTAGILFPLLVKSRLAFSPKTARIFSPLFVKKASEYYDNAGPDVGLSVLQSQGIGAREVKHRGWTSLAIGRGLHKLIVYNSAKEAVIVYDTYSIQDFWFSPDARYIVVWEKDGAVKLRSLEEPEKTPVELGCFVSLSEPEFTTDSRHIILAGDKVVGGLRHSHIDIHNIENPDNIYSVMDFEKKLGLFYFGPHDTPGTENIICETAIGEKITIDRKTGVVVDISLPEGAEETEGLAPKETRCFGTGEKYRLEVYPNHLLIEDSLTNSPIIDIGYKGEIDYRIVENEIIEITEGDKSVIYDLRTPERPLVEATLTDAEIKKEWVYRFDSGSVKNVVCLYSLGEDFDEEELVIDTKTGDITVNKEGSKSMVKVSNDSNGLSLRFRDLAGSIKRIACEDENGERFWFDHMTARAMFFTGPERLNLISKTPSVDFGVFAKGLGYTNAESLFRHADRTNRVGQYFAAWTDNKMVVAKLFPQSEPSQQLKSIVTIDGKIISYEFIGPNYEWLIAIKEKGELEVHNLEADNPGGPVYRCELRDMRHYKAPYYIFSQDKYLLAAIDSEGTIEVVDISNPVTHLRRWTAKDLGLPEYLILSGLEGNYLYATGWCVSFFGGPGVETYRLNLRTGMISDARKPEEEAAFKASSAGKVDEKLLAALSKLTPGNRIEHGEVGYRLGYDGQLQVKILSDPEATNIVIYNLTLQGTFIGWRFASEKPSIFNARNRRERTIEAFLRSRLGDQRLGDAPKFSSAGNARQPEELVGPAISDKQIKQAIYNFGNCNIVSLAYARNRVIKDRTRWGISRYDESKIEWAFLTALGALANSDREVHNEAVRLLAELASVRKELIFFLTEALKLQNPIVTLGAVRALGSIGPAAQEAVPVLLEVLRSPLYSDIHDFLTFYDINGNIVYWRSVGREDARENLIVGNTGDINADIRSAAMAGLIHIHVFTAEVIRALVDASLLDLIGRREANRKFGKKFDAFRKSFGFLAGRYRTPFNMVNRNVDRIPQEAAVLLSELRNRVIPFLSGAKERTYKPFRHKLIVTILRRIPTDESIALLREIPDNPRAGVSSAEAIEHISHVKIHALTQDKMAAYWQSIVVNASIEKARKLRSRRLEEALPVWIGVLEHRPYPKNYRLIQIASMALRELGPKKAAEAVPALEAFLRSVTSERTPWTKRALEWQIVPNINNTIKTLLEIVPKRAQARTTEFLESPGVLGLVSPAAGNAKEIIETALKAGVPRFAAEIPFRGAPQKQVKLSELIEFASGFSKPAVIPVGGVLEGSDAIKAVERGASLIVTPGITLSPTDIEDIHSRGAKVVLGVGSVEEAREARFFRADAIMVFPFNPEDGYLQALEGLLPEELSELVDKYVRIVGDKRHRLATFTNILHFLQGSPSLLRETIFSLPLPGEELVKQIKEANLGLPIFIAGGVSVDMLREGLPSKLGVGAALPIRTPAMAEKVAGIVKASSSGNVDAGETPIRRPDALGITEEWQQQFMELMAKAQELSKGLVDKTELVLLKDFLNDEAFVDRSNQIVITLPDTYALNPGLREFAESVKEMSINDGSAPLFRIIISVDSSLPDKDELKELAGQVSAQGIITAKRKMIEALNIPSLEIREIKEGLSHKDKPVETAAFIIDEVLNLGEVRQRSATQGPRVVMFQNPVVDVEPVSEMEEQLEQLASRKNVVFVLPRAETKDQVFNVFTLLGSFFRAADNILSNSFLQGVLQTVKLPKIESEETTEKTQELHQVLLQAIGCA